MLGHIGLSAFCRVMWCSQECTCWVPLVSCRLLHGYIDAVLFNINVPSRLSSPTAGYARFFFEGGFLIGGFLIIVYYIPQNPSLIIKDCVVLLPKTRLQLQFVHPASLYLHRIRRAPAPRKARFRV